MTTTTPRHMKYRPGMAVKVGPALTSRNTLVVGGVALTATAVVGGVAVSAPAMAATAHTNVVVLRYGATGSLVKTAQQRLGVSGDGHFGPLTQRAVLSFQGRHGLARDGLVGPLTWAKLGGFPSGGGAAAPAPTCSVKVVRYGASGSLVAALQKKLGAAADGEFGPRTLAAVQALQMRQGITADGRGVVGRATWGALGGMPCGLGLTPPGSTSPGGSGGGAPTTTTAKLSQVIGIAKQYLGVPYVYGGSTPRGFDCSGLTQYAYSHAGLTIPRTAAAQQSYMHRTSNPLPGDLIFFGAPAHHVGIYLGGGQMIAAPYPGQVVRVQSYLTPSGFGTLR